MDTNNHANQPHSAEEASHTRRPASVKHVSKKPNQLNKPMLGLFAILLVMIAAFGAWYALSKTGVSGAIDSSKYQAVFLTNGQVYFGKLSAINPEYMRVKDIYYLQDKSTVQKESSPQPASTDKKSDVELIKLGSEIHGPEDEMIVPKDQILFIENLKPAGTVSQTISNFQNNKK